MVPLASPVAHGDGVERGLAAVPLHPDIPRVGAAAHRDDEVGLPCQIITGVGAPGRGREYVPPQCGAMARTAVL